MIVDFRLTIADFRFKKGKIIPKLQFLKLKKK